jgi:hypothetical protein
LKWFQGRKEGNTMKRFLHVVPAYGRDYKSKKEILADWNAGKDFQICDMSCQNDGAYVNKEDAENDSALWEVHVRYAKLSKVMAIRIVRKAA